jgi:Flp pilus assembly protein TadD
VVYKNRGIAYVEKDEYNLAIDDYTKAISLEPNFADAYYKRCIAYAYIGDDNHARLDAIKAKELGHPDAMFLFMLLNDLEKIK